MELLLDQTGTRVGFATTSFSSAAPKLYAYSPIYRSIPEPHTHEYHTNTTQDKSLVKTSAVKFTASILKLISSREAANEGVRGESAGMFTLARFMLLPQFAGDEGRDMNNIVMTPFIIVRHKTSSVEYAIHFEEADKWLGDYCDHQLLKLYRIEQYHPPQHCQVLA